MSDTKTKAKAVQGTSIATEEKTIEIPTTKVVKKAKVNKAQNVNEYSDAQKLALRVFDCMNTVKLRGKFDVDADIYVSGKDVHSFDESTNTYEQERIRVEVTMLGSTELPFRTLIEADDLESLGIGRVNELQGMYCTVIEPIVVNPGDDLPFKVNGETVKYEGANAFNYAQGLNILSNEAFKEMLKTA